PEGRRVPAVHAQAWGARREAVPGQRWNHQVERWAVHPVRARIGEQWNEAEVLDEAAGPPVGQNERNAPPVSRPLVHEMDLDAVDLRPEVLEPVQLALPCAPVEVRPVREQPLQELTLRTLTPTAAC